MADWTDPLTDVEFVNNVTHSLRETPGKLIPLAGESKPYSTSEAKIEDEFGEMNMEEKTARNGDTNNTDPSVKRRFIKRPGSSNVAPLLDRDDFRDTNVELQSPIVREVSQAARKYHGDQFLAGWWGPAWEGTTTAEVEIPFNAGNKVPGNLTSTGASGANTGLTLEKLIYLEYVLGEANVDFEVEKPIILLDSGARADLQRIEEYKNADYSGSTPLAAGELKPFLNFRFMWTNLGKAKSYPKSHSLFNVGGVNRLPVIVPSGIHRGVWLEFWGKISDRGDKNHSVQIFAEAESRVVRTDEQKAWFIETKPAFTA